MGDSTAITRDPMSTETELASGRLRALLSLCRVSNLPTVWMNVLTAADLGSGDLNVVASLVLMLSLSAFHCAGMASRNGRDILRRFWIAKLGTVHHP